MPEELKDQPGKQQDWYQKWIVTDEGKNWQAEAQKAEQAHRDLPRYSATVDTDGRFTIYDMPAGNYKLSVRFWEKPAGHLRNFLFSISQAAANEREVVDLGELQIEN